MIKTQGEEIGVLVEIYVGAETNTALSWPETTALPGLGRVSRGVCASLTMSHTLPPAVGRW